MNFTKRPRGLCWEVVGGEMVRTNCKVAK
jgi:hypothetical protein